MAGPVARGAAQTKRSLGQAARYLDADRTREAEAVLERVLAREPANTDALRLLARVHSWVQQDVALEEVLRRWEAVAPGEPEIPVLRASSAYRNTEYEEALRICEQVLARDGEDVGALVIAAQVGRFFDDRRWMEWRERALEVGGPQASEVLLSQWQDLSLSDTEPWLQVERALAASMLHLHGDPERAMVLVERVLRSKPEGVILELAEKVRLRCAAEGTRTRSRRAPRARRGVREPVG